MSCYALFDFKSDLSDAQLVQFAHNVWTRTTDHPRFAGIKPLVDTSLKPSLDAFVTVVQEAADGSRVKHAEKRARRRSLLEALELVAGHLAILAAGEESVILEAGFSVRSKSSRRDSQEVGQVQGLQVSAGKRPGEALLTFEGVSRALVYAAEWSADGGQHWQNGTYSSARRTVLSGLPERSELLFRVTAIGTGQRKGAPSTPVRQFVY